jgi:Mrp family chromosome partitioning ATPase
MTTTNQAFIKIYRQDAAQAGPSRAIADDDRLSAVAIGASVEIVAAGANYGSCATDRRSTGDSELATSIDVLPPPMQPSVASTFLFKTGLGEAARGSRPQQSLRTDDAGGKTKRPLSAYMARQQAPQPAATQTKTIPFRAGTTVASFRWPAVCRALAQEAAAELDGVADLLQDRVALGHSTFGVLSLFPNGGCTTTAFCLATRLAARNQRVVLVEGSFYTPRLAQWIDVVPTASWQEVLDSNAPVTDALVQSVDERLDVLLLSSMSPSDPLLLAGSPQAMNTAELLRQRYELVLVDLGAYFDPRSQPVTIELARSLGIEAAVVVAGPNPVDARDLATVEENLNGRGCELLGIIENRVRPTSIND